MAFNLNCPANMWTSYVFGVAKTTPQESTFVRARFVFVGMEYGTVKPKKIEKWFIT